MTVILARAPWRATHPDFSDDIRLSPEALSHLHKHRQLGFMAREAGGQLFGHTVETGLDVVTATGPYRGDTRTRTSYRSNPRAAAKAIAEMRERGLFYLGEWHTHPELHPRPSGSDINAFIQLVKNSRFATAVPVLVVQGQDCSPMGLAVLTYENCKFLPWSVVDSPSAPAALA